MAMRLVNLQLLLAFAMAQAQNGALPSSERIWSPPNLANYERDLAAYHSRTADDRSLFLFWSPLRNAS
jgi:hypothetical protein